LPFARLLGVEHDANEKMPAGGETRKYGGTSVTLYRVEEGKGEGGRGKGTASPPLDAGPRHADA
jgi:hypothetical protein